VHDVSTSLPSPRLCPVCGEAGQIGFLQAPDRFHGKKEMYSLVRCGTCSLVWLENPPTPETMAKHYGDDYDTAISVVGQRNLEEHWSDPRKSLLFHKTEGTLLDLGCSSGGFLASMKSPSWKLYGIEMSQPMAERARASTGAEIFVGDVLDAHFTDATFDAITCFHLFEHVYQPRRLLQKILTWLKPGGVFLAYMPNIDSGAARCFKSYWYGLELPRHLYHYSPTSLAHLAKSVGFSEIAVTTHREPFVERSSRYLAADLLGKFNVTVSPQTAASHAPIPWRVVRKGFRLTLLPIFNQMFAFAGPGEIMHAVLKKNQF
jgi:SAM-dependent methyltransferase